VSATFYRKLKLLQFPPNTSTIEECKSLELLVEGAVQYPFNGSPWNRAYIIALFYKKGDGPPLCGHIDDQSHIIVNLIGIDQYTSNNVKCFQYQSDVDAQLIAQYLERPIRYQDSTAASSFTKSPKAWINSEYYNF